MIKYKGGFYIVEQQGIVWDYLDPLTALKRVTEQVAVNETYGEPLPETLRESLRSDYEKDNDKVG